MGNNGSKRSSAYSRHSGEGMGSYTHRTGKDTGHANSVLIGRQRITKQFSKNLLIHVSTITAPYLGKILVELCGNEGRHPYLDEQGRTTLLFMRAAISFIPFALEAGADLRNASFIFAQPGREFAIKAGKGDWEFYFSQDNDGNICGRCVRKPALRYIWDEVKKVVKYLLPILGPPVMAALMAA
ncbi:uncharacterized protein LOC144662190 [Oculina patagonica]